MERPRASSNERDRLPRPIPLTGRRRETSVLHQLLAPTGPVGFGVVSGTGGSGKTRLLEETVAEARRRGWRVAAARAYPLESGLPYSLFGDAFRPILDDLGPERVRLLTRGSEFDLAVVFPGLSSSAPPVTHDSEEFRSRLLWSFTTFVETLGRDRPLLVVLDDLHWADEASLKLLHFLARRATSPSVRFLASYNEVDRDSGPNWARLEHALLGLSTVQMVRIGDLERGDVVELVGRCFGVDSNSLGDFPDRLFEWTRGNPYFLEQSLLTLVERGDLYTRDGIWLGWEAPLADLSASTREVIQRRLRDLSPEGANLIARLAVLGGRASSYLLERIAELPTEKRLHAIEELIASRLVTEITSEVGPPTYGIEHPQVRRTIYTELSGARRARLHGVVGEALESRGDAGRPKMAHEIGKHLARSDRPEHHARAVESLIMAGRWALERHAPTEAREDLRRALDLASTPELEVELDPAARNDLVALLAQAHGATGHVLEAQALWSQALAATPESNRARRARLLVQLGLTRLAAGEPGAALATLGDALAEAEASGDSGVVTEVLLARGSARQDLGRGDEARQDLEAALERAEGDVATRARAHRFLGMLRIWTGPPEVAHEHLSTGLALAEEIEDLELRFWCSLGLAMLEMMTRRGSDLDRLIQAAGEVSEMIGSPLLRLRVDELRIEQAYAEGRWEAAIVLGEQAIARARELGVRTLLPRLLVWTSAIYLGRGDRARAEAFVQEACDLAGLDKEAPSDVHALVPAHIGLAHFHLVSGSYEEAIRVAERGIAIAEGSGYVLWVLHRLLPILAEAHLWLEDTEGAERVGSLMRAHAGRLDHKLGEIFADACDALIIWKRGDPELGATRMAEAADALEAVPMLPVAARIRRQMAGRLAEIGATDASVRELRRVHDAFLRMGLEHELEKARGQFREVGVRPPARAMETGLSARELEIAKHVATGASNKAVGRRLGISPRTVSTHLTKIFQKLSISRRDQVSEALERLPPS